MAFYAKLSDLTNENITLIHRVLTMQPVNKEAEKMKKYHSSSSKNIRAPPPIGFFKVIDLNKREKTVEEINGAAIGSIESSHVSIPFRFACGLLKKMVNRDIVYPKVTERGMDRPHFAITLKENQVEIAKELYQQLATYGATTLGLPTGWGKTIVGAWLWHMTATILCVLITRTALIRSWLNTVKLCFPGLIDRIWVVGDTLMPSDPAIIICMVDRHTHVPEYVRKQVGCVIIDEAHLFCTPNAVDCLLYFTPKFVMAETATLERENDGMEIMIHAMCGTHGVFRISNKPYTIYRLRTFMLVPEEKNFMGKDFNKMSQKLSLLQERNNIIFDIIWRNQHRKFIILTKFTEHAQYLTSAINAAGIKCASLFGNQKSYSDSPVLVGNRQKMGTGFDEAQFCSDFADRGSDTLIFTYSVKQKANFEQERGRLRIENSIIIYLVDENDAPKRHFKNMVPWIIETKGKIVEVDYTPGAIILPLVNVTINVPQLAPASSSSSSTNSNSKISA